MSKGRYEHKGRRRRRTFGSKSLALVLACVLLVGGVIGGTLAWLTADGGSVTNTFTESDINITLIESGDDETAAPGQQRSFEMVPGWTIDKDPKVTVDADSEDCWLFVKITESTDPDLDAYISYAIAEGWQIVEPTNNSGNLANISTLADEIVIGRKVYKDDATKEFGILGAGNFTDSMGTDATTDDFPITWEADEVCVKPSVTKQMMAAIETQKPTLTFQAYAVQLFKINSDGDKPNTAGEFTAEEAWARAGSMSNN